MTEHSLDLEGFHFCPWKGRKEEGWAEGKEAIFICWGCPDKVPQNLRPGSLHNRNPLPHTSRDLRSEIRVSARPCSLGRCWKGLFWASLQASGGSLAHGGHSAFTRCLLVWRMCPHSACRCVYISFYKDTSCIGLGPTQMTSS